MAPTMFIFLPEKCHVGTIEQYIATLMVIKVVFLAKKKRDNRYPDTLGNNFLSSLHVRHRKA